jgi:hypothetical protein
MRMSALARTAGIVNDRPILSSEILYKDYGRQRSVVKKLLAVCLMGLGASRKVNLTLTLTLVSHCRR